MAVETDRHGAHEQGENGSETEETTCHPQGDSMCEADETTCHAQCDKADETEHAIATHKARRIVKPSIPLPPT